MNIDFNKIKQVLNLSDDELNGVKLAVKYMCEKQGLNYS